MCTKSIEQVSVSAEVVSFKDLGKLGSNPILEKGYRNTGKIGMKFLLSQCYFLLSEKLY